MAILVNETDIIVNGTAVVNNNMPIKPETFIIIIGVFFLISLFIGIGFMIWAKFK